MDSFFTKYQLYKPDDIHVFIASMEGHEWAQGKARTETLTTKVKHNLELETKDGKDIQKLLEGHQKALHLHKGILMDHMLKHVSTPKFNKYVAPDGDYQRHCDSSHMMGIRTDLACTTFLTDPDSYEGGELNIEDYYGNVHSCKGKIGECIVYQCGQPHWVSPVTSGERIGIICWIQSHFRSFETRNTLSGLAKTVEAMEPLAMKDEKLFVLWTELGAYYSQFLKMLIDD